MHEFARWGLGEYGIPAVVGARGVRMSIRPGQRLPAGGVSAWCAEQHLLNRMGGSIARVGRFMRVDVA